MLCQYNGYSDRIRFANAIILDQVKNKGEQHLCYMINQCKIKVIFDIIINISDHVTLIQMMDKVVDVNCEVIITGDWIYIQIITNNVYWQENHWIYSVFLRMVIPWLSCLEKFSMQSDLWTPNPIWIFLNRFWIHVTSVWYWYVNSLHIHKCG